MKAEGKRQPRISVIMPVYNTIDYIDRAVKSVCCQTYTNLEIILVDDGSDDGSEKYCDEAAGKDCRIRVIHQKNGGVSSARNQGLKVATGEYIAFVDADDYLEPFMYELLLTKLQQEQSQIAMCNGYVEEDDKKSRLYFEHMSDKVLNGKQAIIQMHYLNQVNTELWNKLFHREMLDGVHFQEGLKIGEDYQALVQIFLKTEKISVSATPAYHYIQRGSGAMSSGYIKAGQAVDFLFAGMKEKAELKKEEALYRSTVCFCDNHLLSIAMQMIRNNHVDRMRLEEIRKSLKATVGIYCKEKNAPLHFKAGSVLCSLNLKVFLLLGRLFYGKKKDKRR